MTVYPNIVASGDHVSQLILASGSGAQVVADRLVSLPPGPPGVVQNYVLIWRRNLSNRVEIILHVQNIIRFRFNFSRVFKDSHIEWKLCFTMINTLSKTEIMFPIFEYFKIKK